MAQKTLVDEIMADICNYEDANGVVHIDAEEALRYKTECGEGICQIVGEAIQDWEVPKPRKKSLEKNLTEFIDGSISLDHLLQLQDQITNAIRETAEISLNRRINALRPIANFQELSKRAEL